MTLDPTGRFSSRVEDYIRYRPGYPNAVLELLERECGLRPGARVADIGSGTGLLSQVFLSFGCEVFAVEPNPEMRGAGERRFANQPLFHSVAGRAEDTGLSPGSVDLVAAGQAFHWFDPQAARAEFQRILGGPRYAVLVWNERLVEGPFLEGYEALLHRYCPDYSRVDHRRMGAGAMDDFFGQAAWQLASFPNVQEFDLEGLLGRLHSSSYAPQPGSPVYQPLEGDMAHLFAAHQRQGRVAFVYATKVYYGKL